MQSPLKFVGRFWNVLENAGEKVFTCVEKVACRYFIFYRNAITKYYGVAQLGLDSCIHKFDLGMEWHGFNISLSVYLTQALAPRLT